MAGPMTSVALIGLGEVGRVIAEELSGSAPGSVSSWDTAFADRASPASRNAAALGLSPGASAAQGIAGAGVIFSAVTAANTLRAAESAAEGIAPEAWYVDLNSASPVQKMAAAAVIAQAGGRYVEAAVMSPIHPRRLAAPVLLGGPHAAAFEPIGRGLGWTGLEVYSDRIGPAAATKLARSVVVKGLEALVTESMLTARAWGVEDYVLGSLSNVIPVPDWPAFAQYLVSRAVQHGTRRAEEMREAAETLTASGVTPWLASATAERQDWAGQFELADPAEDLFSLIDRMRATS
jgi:3-hydroxyisobutyrate dehydrogenase-like beta-hydroxyacid dehydrogenase